ncbi:MAG TPA: Rnase Y domain-containing protein, partial [Bacillota bacterium]|nr:Rnase Y domain-containing protein [Bacillota bacterium]
MPTITILIAILASVGTLVVGILIGYIIRKNVAEKTIGSAEQTAKNLVLDAENKAETIKKEIALEAKEEAHRLRSEIEREIRERREEIKKSEKRLIQKEESIDKKLDNIEKKEENILLKEQKIIEKQQEVDRFLEKQMEELERISGYSVEEAKALLLSNCEKEIRYEASLLIKDIIQKAKDEGDKKAKEIITGAIQRCAA